MIDGRAELAIVTARQLTGEMNKDTTTTTFVRSGTLPLERQNFGLSLGLGVSVV